MPSSPIITKVTVPPRAPGTLHRERLTDFLHEHIDRKVILVSAPAGYGKTTMLVDFTHETDLPVCWYRLDPTLPPVPIPVLCEASTGSREVSLHFAGVGPNRWSIRRIARRVQHP